MNTISKLKRSLVIVGAIIGMLGFTDQKADARTRVSGRFYTPFGDVYIESGHRYRRGYRHYYHNPYRYRRYHRPYYYYDRPYYYQPRGYYYRRW